METKFNREIKNAYSLCFTKHEFEPLGLALVMQGTHLCKTMRGAKKNGKMTSSYLTGVFKEDPLARSEFMNLIKK